MSAALDLGKYIVIGSAVPAGLYYLLCKRTNQPIQWQQAGRLGMISMLAKTAIDATGGNFTTFDPRCAERELMLSNTAGALFIGLKVLEVFSLTTDRSSASPTSAFVLYGIANLTQLIARHLIG